MYYVIHQCLYDVRLIMFNENIQWKDNLTSEHDITTFQKDYLFHKTYCVYKNIHLFIQEEITKEENQILLFNKETDKYICHYKSSQGMNMQ